MYVPNQVEPVQRSTNTESSRYHLAGAKGGVAPSSIDASGWIDDIAGVWKKVGPIAGPILGSFGF